MTGAAKDTSLTIDTHDHYDTFVKMDGSLDVCGAPALDRLVGGARILMTATN
jgi:hypothetical protein